MAARLRLALLSAILVAIACGGAARAVRSVGDLTITPPADMSVEATEQCGQTFCARVSYSFTATGGTPPYRFVCNLDSGGLFTVGTHRIDCMASDSRGSSTPQASFTLTVTGGGTPAPPPPPAPPLSISPPSDITAQATTRCNQLWCAQVSYAFTVTGGYPPYRLVCNLDSPAMLLVGSHQISCMASDSRGNSTPEAHFTATVTAPNDPQPAATTPTVTTQPAPTTTSSTASTGATPAAGSSTSPAEATAPKHDANGPAAADTHPPTIGRLAALTLPATTSSGVVARYAAIATDPDTRGADVIVSCAPASGSRFPLGSDGSSRTTTVTCTARDAAGHSAAPRSFTVTVLGADSQLVALERDVRGAVALAPRGRARLRADLNSAALAVAAGEGVAAQTALRRFGAHVRTLPAFPERATWLAAATRIAAVLAD